MFKKIAVLILAASPLSATYAAGQIKGINFSGPEDSSHKNIVQIQIEGGLNSANCNMTFAAIRNTPEHQHMISFALAAMMSKTPVEVVLNETDKYHTDRCTISRISSVY